MLSPGRQTVSRYLNNNGLNIDLFKEMPQCVFTHAKGLTMQLQNAKYNQKALNHYRRKYLPKDLGHATEQICSVILKHLGSK